MHILKEWRRKMKKSVDNNFMPFEENVHESIKAMWRKPYLKVSEVAILLGVSRSTIYRQIKLKRIHTTVFGILTEDVITAFELEPYVERLGIFKSKKDPNE